ncbi:MAG: hypothetical protein RLY85_145 [Bacteroidota bacterium]|jgi:uncharacterized protein (TIGR02453 family)
MIGSATINFLKELKENNNKDWFELHRKNYEAAKQDYLKFVTAVLGKLKSIDPTLEDLEPKKCVFRINRDVRFSKNKDPYKTNMGSFYSKGGKAVECAGYYFHLEPGACFIGGGYWMPQGPVLKNIRSEIDYNLDEFNSIMQEKSMKKYFGALSKEARLSRPPQGYEADNPAIEYLKLKSFVVTAPLPDVALADSNLVNLVVDHFKAMKPLVHFLNRSLD